VAVAAALPEVAGATLIAGAARAAAAGLAGASGSASAQATSNVLSGQPITHNLAQATATGAVLGAGLQAASATLGAARAASSAGAPSASARNTLQTTTKVARTAEDIAVSPKAPPALSTNRPIGTSATQNAAAQTKVAEMKQAGYTDIRVNQHQVNYEGERVGINRPDVAGNNPATKQRENIEYGRSSSTREDAHEARIKANDPKAKVTKIKQD
jgi:hypothetical protein